MVDSVTIIAGAVIVGSLLLLIAVGIAMIVTSATAIVWHVDKEWNAIIRRDINDEPS